MRISMVSLIAPVLLLLLSSCGMKAENPDSFAVHASPDSFIVEPPQTVPVDNFVAPPPMPSGERYLTAGNTVRFLLDEIYSDSVVSVIGGDRVRVLDAPDGEIVTEAEYLEPVVVLGRDPNRPEWCSVELPVQRGYTGFVRRSDIIELVSGPYEGAAVVSVPSATATGAPDGGVNVRALRGATVVPIRTSTRNYVQIDTQEGPCWLSRSEVHILEENTSPSPQDIIATARDMTGSPYVWGGTTWGTMDCSGFVNLVFRMNGCFIKRDCGIQFSDSTGSVVTAEESLPGDLIYISTYQPGPSHVGILTGEGRVIHCGSSGVSEISLRGSVFSNREVIGYKRFTDAALQVTIPTVR